MLERSIALGMSLAEGTVSAYMSALNSYITFCHLHNFTLDPTPDTLSFFVTWLCAHVKPDTVATYLSGIVNCLETHYPHARTSCRHPLVAKTLAGCRRRFGTPRLRKKPAAAEDISRIAHSLPRPWSFDDITFLTLLLCGFLSVLRLSELTVPDSRPRTDYCKITSRATAHLTTSNFSFILPTHKADQFFEGNKIIIVPRPHLLDPLLIIKAYLSGRDKLFPFHPQLWLASNGQPPRRSWFLQRLHSLGDKAFGGHSLRAGGATDLALHGASLQVIQAAGRWASDAFQQYIQKNPFLIHAALAQTPNA